MLKDFFAHIRLVDEADDPHLSLALGAGQRVCWSRLAAETGWTYYWPWSKSGRVVGSATDSREFPFLSQEVFHG